MQVDTIVAIRQKKLICFPGFSVVKFCEHGTTPGGQTIPGKET
jgi:hypothetical protein